MLDIPLYRGGRPRAWSDLSDDEKRRLSDALVNALGGNAKGLIGEIYSVNRYEKGSGMHDAKEFSTVLNSCGRYDDAATGARICAGDLSAIADADRHRQEHRKNIAQAMAMIRDGHLMRLRINLQFFDAGDRIRDTVVGIVAGMILSSDLADPDIPLLGLAKSPDGTKVSARAPKELVRKGLNLSDIMRDAAAEVGGMGGGHAVAAGATVPEDRAMEFVDIVDRKIGDKLRSLSPS